jgi:nanoRNase/pAp phosphatase (c-di-AMP/oligoRNAs hydrolase)
MAVSGVDRGKKKVKYLIFGCGSTGYNVVEALLRETPDILIIDRDDKRVEDLRVQKFNAIVRDLTSPSLIAGLPEPDVALVLSNDKDANLTAVRTIRAAFPKAHLIARATDPVSIGMLQEAGGDLVLYPQEVLAREVESHLTQLHSSRLARRLYDLMAGWEGTLGIVTHTNPDPDSISSAMALVAIAAEANPKNLSCRILYGGNIGHQENRAFVNLLDINMERITPQVLKECDYLALVDSLAPGMNNDLSKKTQVNIVIDHHTNGDTPEVKGDFVDIRSGIGATASIMAQYLKELSIGVNKKVATALLYGIQADTRYFRRNVTPADFIYAAFLLPYTDLELLEKITSPAISQETLDVLGNAIRNRKVRSGYLFSNIGYVRNRDALPQAADLLINLEGVNTALVFGIGDSAIYISARNKDIRLHIGNVLSEAFGDIGEAGGHPNMAAATIPLAYFALVKTKDDLLSLVLEPIMRKFLRVVGLEKEESHEIFEI